MINHGKKNSGSVNVMLIAVILFFVTALGLGALIVARFRDVRTPRTPTSCEMTPAPAEEAAPASVQPTPEPTLSPEEVKAMEEAALAEAAAKKAEAQKYSFYQKLEKGYDTNLLILGDESAMDKESDGINGIVDGPRFGALSAGLQEKYHGKVSINNLANTRGNVLCDVMRINDMPDEPAYDLIILSYGLNEQKNDIQSNFEALIISLHNKFPDGAIICSIEPCFHAVTGDFETMINVSNTCGIPVINLFTNLYNKGIETYFDYFEDDQTIPNEKGMEEWIRLICKTIDENVENSTGKMTDPPVTADKSQELAKLHFIPITDPRVSRKDDASYALNMKAEGRSYIRHKEMLGKDEVKVIADGILYSFGKPTGVETPDGTFITPIYDHLICENEFTIVFSGKELADGLEGFYLIEKTVEEK